MIHIVNDERCVAYSRDGHPERPQRIEGSLELLRATEAIKIQWEKPDDGVEAAALLAHSEDHWDRLHADSEDFDADTPRYPDIDQHARRSMGAALKTMRLARNGQTAFSLMRPPGHHATPNRAMGFCYLNSIAIACLQAQADGVERVAVFDFDVHHGNGTESILKGRRGTLFASVHQYPLYPMSGETDVEPNCFNFTVPIRVDRPQYRSQLQAALDRVLEFKPGLIGVSAGFDGYVGDPLANGCLTAEDFEWIGASLRESGVPFFSILEGGYSDDLPELILAYLKGIDPGR